MIKFEKHLSWPSYKRTLLLHIHRNVFTKLHLSSWGRRGGWWAGDEMHQNEILQVLIGIALFGDILFVFLIASMRIVI